MKIKIYRLSLYVVFQVRLHIIYASTIILGGRIPYNRLFLAGYSGPFPVILRGLCNASDQAFISSLESMCSSPVSHLPNQHRKLNTCSYFH